MSVIEQRGWAIEYGGTEKGFVNKETGEKYRRIIGGIAWPLAIKPGYVVVVAEDKKQDESLKKYHLRLLTEYEHQNPSELLRRCAEYQAQYLVEQWCGDNDNKPMMEFLRNQKFDLYLQKAPLLDDPHCFDFYLALIREWSKAGKKILHFGLESKLPNCLMGLSQENIPRTRAHEFFPPVFALGAVLSYIHTYSYDPNEQARADAANAELAELMGVE